MKRLLVSMIIFTFASPALAQRDQKVDPLFPADLVYVGPESGTGCAIVSYFFGSNPCHVGMLTGSSSVTEAAAGVEPNSVRVRTLAEFQSVDYRSAMTSYPRTPSAAQRQTMLDYLEAKAARLTYYDANHLNQKGGYAGGCGYGVASCWDGWDYYNEFDCVGLTERASELALLIDEEGLTPDHDELDGCTWEGFLLYPSDQYFSCRTTYTQAFPALGESVLDTVKSGYWRLYAINIPANVVSISASTTSDSDIDLYLGRHGFVPSLESWVCRPYTSSGSEHCELDNPAEGVWVFGVHGYASSTSSYAITILQSGPPNVITLPPTSITSTSAHLRGTVTANGAPTTTAFDYGTTASYGQSVMAQTVSGTSPQAVSADIFGLACNTAYHYRVRATNAQGSAFGSDGIFRSGNCLVSFTDDPLIPGVTVIKAVHVIELRNTINAIRSSVSRPPYPFTSLINAGGLIRAAHILELRSAVDETRTALGLPRISYTNPVIVGSVVRAADIMDVRNALR